VPALCANDPRHADLILTTKGEQIVVQARRWKNPVGVQAVHAAFSAITYYRARRAIIVTSGGFTRQAMQLAEHTNVELWDRNRLVDSLRQTNVELPEPPSRALTRGPAKSYTKSQVPRQKEG